MVIPRPHYSRRSPSFCVLPPRQQPVCCCRFAFLVFRIDSWVALSAAEGLEPFVSEAGWHTGDDHENPGHPTPGSRGRFCARACAIGCRSSQAEKGRDAAHPRCRCFGKREYARYKTQQDGYLEALGDPRVLKSFVNSTRRSSLSPSLRGRATRNHGPLDPRA